jgi:hypothetical protein
MARFAENTTVSPERSQAELQRILERYGANQIGVAYDNSRVRVEFFANARRIRFTIAIPDLEEFKYDSRKRPRTAAMMQSARYAEKRRRWRALVLAVKAKLEVVESEIATFEEEFAAHIVLPDGSTVAEYLIPSIAEAYETGRVPALLPGSVTQLRITEGK